MAHTRPAHFMAAALLLAGATMLSGCLNYNPVDEPDGDPDATPRPTNVSTAAPAATGSPGSSPIGSAHVALTVATANAVTIDVTDASSSLIGASTGTPGDGASVEAYTLVVTNASPTMLRLTWVGGPCDSANSLSIDASRHQFLLVQPECPGDATVTDRVLNLEFATPIQATDVEAFLQDGIDT